MTGPDLATLATYFRLMNTNGAAQVYHTALEAGVLSGLDGGPLAVGELAEKCRFQARPLALLLEALAAMGLVRESAGEYSLTSVARMLLQSDYRELGNQYWRHLPDFLKSGVPLKKMDDAEQSETHYQAQAAMLGWMLSHAAEEAAEVLDARLGGKGVAILDVGAGSAIWSLSLAKRNDESRVTAVDWPAVLEVAQETAGTFGIAERLTTIAGNCHQVEFPAAAFDLAFVANLTHLQTPAQNQALFAKVHRALRSGGQIMIVDAFPAQGEENIPLALYHLGLALRTEQGRVYPPEELRAMLLTAGFDEGEVIPLQSPPFVVGMLAAGKR